MKEKLIIQEVQVPPYILEVIQEVGNDGELTEAVKLLLQLNLTTEELNALIDNANQVPKDYAIANSEQELKEIQLINLFNTEEIVQLTKKIKLGNQNIINAKKIVTLGTAAELILAYNQ